MSPFIPNEVGTYDLTSPSPESCFYNSISNSVSQTPLGVNPAIAILSANCCLDVISRLNVIFSPTEPVDLEALARTSLHVLSWLDWWLATTNTRVSRIISEFFLFPELLSTLTVQPLLLEGTSSYIPYAKG